MVDVVPPEPILAVKQDGSAIAAVGLEAITTLIHSFASMMQSMEARLTDRIRDNATASKERWAVWEEDFKAYRDAMERRVQTLEASVHDHHAEAEKARIVQEARVKPVLMSAAWIGKHWKDIAIITLFLATAFVEIVVGLSERLP